MVLNYLFGDKITKLNINDFFLYLNYLRSLNVDYDILDIFAKLYSFADNDSVLPYLDLLNNKEILIKSKKEEFQKIISKK